MKKLILLLVMGLLSTNYAVAHPGRTDSNGGHYNRKTGAYHYHNGGRNTNSSSSSNNSTNVHSNRKITSDDIGNYVSIIQDANLREGPGKEQKIVKIAKKDTIAKIIDVQGDWANIQIIGLEELNAWIDLSLLRS